MPTKNSNGLSTIAQEIEHYFRTNPHAADSLEGVVKWWLPKQRYQETLDQVQTALNFLVAQGRIGKRVNLNGTDIYIKQKNK